MKVLAVYLKEMLDTLRDRRALFSALSFGLFGPLAVVFTVNVLAAATRPTALAPVAVCSGEAPELVEHLTAAGLTFAPQADICLHIPDDYAARLAAGATANVRVLADLTAASATVDKLRSEIQRYARTWPRSARSRAELQRRCSRRSLLTCKAPMRSRGAPMSSPAC